MDESAIERMLGEVTTQATAAFGADLKSVVVFGSAAENRLRPASDVNVIFLFERFEAQQAAAWAASLRAACSAIKLEPMILTVRDLPDVVDAFAVKFADIARRRRVVFGPDPFADLRVDRAAHRRRLMQVLTNLILRLRRGRAVHADQPDALARLIASLSGPLRVAAGSLRELRGDAPASPRDSLAALAREFDGARAEATMAAVSDARALLAFDAGRAVAAATALEHLAQLMRERIRTLAP